ncbi:Hypothetical protein PBC10988_25600 [Planctomycetales bacterium 10988]|nr:Hypothetical protein PBC10988_25600 [Planctomycetales bacterium 10988]
MTTSADAQPVRPSKLVYVLPRIRLSGTAYREERFAISQANFLPDEPSSWAEVIQLPRPDWLNIYRQFPYLHSEEPAEPAHGTLIISDDEEWLRKHVSRLIAVVYTLGLDESQWQVPADAFQYSAFKATEQPHDLVTLFTKSGGKTEDLRSLQLLPPLELRGVPTSFRVNLRDEKHAELIRRFDSNPYDRLTVACYHLFRSQFDNPVVAPSEQDFSAYCACLEASLDVTGPDYSKELSDKLAEIYGKHTKLERWIKGLYSERSVFNHGVSSEPTLDSPDDRVRALAEFRQRSLNWDVLRKLCLDVIKEQLQESLDSAKRELARLMSPTRTMLRKFFFSEEIWSEIVKVFTQSKSVDTIRAFTGKDHDDFIELCCSYLNGHDWQAMKGKADPKKVCEVLKTMAAIFGEAGRAANNAEDIAAAHELFQGADSEDGEAIGRWERNHSQWEQLLAAQDIGDAAKAVAARTARFFRATS